MSKRILLVEDNEDWRRMAAGSLKEAGYEVIGVSGASEAALQKDEPNLSLIVLDLDLGGENGLMLMKHLKKHHPGTPILIYTGMEPDQQAVQRMRDQGADFFLRKGAMSELIEVVRQRISACSPKDSE
jgi:DNA-binding NtrC family response regulator